MTAIRFYKFINENEIEFHWYENPETEKNDVIIFVPFHLIEQLNKILTNSSYNEDGILCAMKDGYFAYWASDILDRYDIELTEVFNEPNK